MQVVIPAAGRGTRFLPLSRYVPKELLPLGDRPVIHHALDEAARAGFDAAVVVLSPEKAVLRDYLTEVELPIPVDFVEQPCPAGLGDAVLCCRGHVDELFGVLLPDDVLPGDGHWRALFEAQERTGGAVLCLRPVPPAETGRFGIASCRAEAGHLRVEQLTEKPAPGTVASNLAILGRYLVSPAVMAALGQTAPAALSEVQLTDAFAAVVDDPPGVVAIRHHGEVLDCGTPEDYQRSVSRYLSSAKSGEYPAVGRGRGAWARAEREAS